MTGLSKLSRRDFLKISTTALGGLAVTVHLPSFAINTQNEVVDLGLFVHVEPSGKIVIGARGTEIGQGVKTSLPMLIAEELDVAWQDIEVKQLPFVALPADNERGYTTKYGGQGAGGSTSIPDSWEPLRKAGAQARKQLMQAASEFWNVPIGDLKTREGHVASPTGDKKSYGELANKASKITLDDSDLVLKSPDQFRIIGQPHKTVDGPAIVTGRGYFGIDARVDDALVAVIARCPYFEGGIDKVDKSAALAIPGVKHVVEIPAPDPEKGLVGNLAAGVAVVAVDTWSAMKGRDALQIDWKPGPWYHDSTEKLTARAYAAMEGEATIARQDGDVQKAIDNDSQVIRAQYLMPFLAHSTLEPQNALISLQKDSALFIGSTQQPHRTARTISAITGIPVTNIDVQIPRSGGGFGRRLEADFVAEAAHVAKAVEQPVRLIWTRPDDLQNDFYRPFGLHGLTAAIDGEKKLTAWKHRVAATDRRFRIPGLQRASEWIACLDPDAFPANCVENYQAEFVPLEFGLARGWWRGPLPTFAAFANQSFMHEVAYTTGQDPLDFQLKLLGNDRDYDYRDHGGPKFNTGRLRRVLTSAAKTIGYGRELAPGRGIGIAGYFVFGGYAAHAMEVSVEQNTVKIHRCVIAADVGRIVNPLGVEAQMMGGTIDGISTALNLEITVEEGKVIQNNFPDYPHLRMADAPDVEVVLIPSDLPPGGAGEMGIPTAAPALANAIFEATGKRIRNMPFNKYWQTS